MTEDLATLVTLIGFLTRVDSLMYDEGRAPDEGLATLLTFVGFLARVDSPVLSQARALSKTLSTFMANVPPLPRGGFLPPL